MIAEVYKILHPLKHFNHFVNKNTRPDGRNFNKFRDIKLSIKTLKTADASAVVKVGNTTVICGIKLELAKPKAEEPNTGYLVTNVEIPAICSSKIRTGPPSDFAQVTSSLLSDILKDSQCFDLNQLCIVPHKLAWVIRCDILCFNNDGSVLDACLIALIGGLKSLSMPSVEFDVETSEIKVDENVKTPLVINGIPVATSFSIYKEVILADPTAYEEEICCDMGANLVICCIGDMLCGMHKFSSSCVVNEEKYNLCMELAKQKATTVQNLIESSIKESI